MNLYKNSAKKRGIIDLGNPGSEAKEGPVQLLNAPPPPPPRELTHRCLRVTDKGRGEVSRVKAS